MAEQRSLKLPDDTVIYCYSDGSIERLSKAHQHTSAPLRRDFGCDDSTGYLYIKVNKRHYKVHRLIAKAFVPNPLGLPEVDHINRDRHDNRPENLRWATRTDNCRNTEKGLNSQQLYGIRCFEDKKAYTKAHGAIYRKKALVLTMINPNGNLTSRVCTEDEYKTIKPLSLKERLVALNALRMENSLCQH